MQKKVESLQSVITKSSVNSVLVMVRQLASRPSALVDPYALVAALEQLADVSRETNHPERRRFEAIFKQCRPLVREPKLATVVIQLLGDKEEKQVAGQIHKLLSTIGFKSIPSVRAVPAPLCRSVQPASCVSPGFWRKAYSPNAGKVFSMQEDRTFC